MSHTPRPARPWRTHSARARAALDLPRHRLGTCVCRETRMGLAKQNPCSRVEHAMTVPQGRRQQRTLRRTYTSLVAIGAPRLWLEFCFVLFCLAENAGRAEVEYKNIKKGWCDTVNPLDAKRATRRGLCAQSVRQLYVWGRSYTCPCY